jgi:hypothetical protein
MDRQVAASAPTNTSRNVRLLGYPDQCPRCHSKLVPRHIGTFARSLEKERDIEEVFQCTSAKCGGLFIAVYGGSHLGSNPPTYQLARSVPLEPVPPPISEIVSALSPTFVETYTQALVAESLGLSQLTGIGLRKALEFLVKDFAVSENSTQAEAIRKKTLAACISDHVADVNTKAMAKRATWLGNDETHYVRRWEDKDVSDLKILLRLSINGIENSLLTKHYLAAMPEA